MAYKNIFFDLDGTLTDPKIGITKSVQYALKKFGIEEETESLIHFIGPPLHKSFEKFYGFDEKKAMEGVAFYREYYIPHGLYESMVYKDMPHFLKKLRDENKKLSIVTSKPAYLAEVVAKHHHIASFFEKIIGPEPDLSNADKTILIKEALAFFPEEKKESFVMIGDRKHDIIAAKANKIDSIGVLFGYGSEQEINDARPTHIAKTITELEQYLL